MSRTPTPEVEDRIEEMAIEYAKRNICINPQCDNDGVLVVMGRDGEPEQEQCEYCYRVRFPEIELYRQALTTTRNEAIEECIKLSDEIELREPDGGTKQWMAFKCFRNTLRDRLQALKK